MKPVIVPRPSPAAFTLPEVMIAVSVLVVVLGGVIGSHLFALRLFEITKAKLGANQDARAAISRLGDEIRSAKWIQVGMGSMSGFTEAADDTAQVGNALQLYSTATNNPFVRYYLDTNVSKLYRMSSGSKAVSEIATCVSNQLVFSSENSQGVVLTNNENNRVIGLTLNFYQLQYPIIRIGPGEYYDYYQLRTRFTRRNLE